VRKLGSFLIKAKVAENAKKRTNRLTSCVLPREKPRIFWTIFEEFSIIRGFLKKVRPLLAGVRDPLKNNFSNSK
jgi:hypothetical protein